MALTGLDFPSPTIQQHNLDPAFINMERRSIDLNKHAFDLNEVPLNDLNLGFHDASSSHERVNSWLPRKGGWLELFRNMFGQECVMGNFPFTPHATAPSSSNNNTITQTDQKVHSDYRIPSNQTLHSDHGSHQNQEKGKQSGPGGKNLTSLPQQQRLIFHTPFLPIPEQVSISSHVGQPCYDVLGQPGCRDNFFTALCPAPEQVSISSSVGQPNYDALGLPKYGDSFHTSFHLIPEQGNGSGTTEALFHGFNQYKAPIPLWDLNSHPIPQWNADPISESKGPCHASSGQSFDPAYDPGKIIKEAQTQILKKDEDQGPCVQAFYDASQTNFRQLNAFAKQDKSCTAVSTCSKKKNGFSSSQKKCGGASERGKALDPQSSTADTGKAQEPRVKIIASPDWLPAGWITEVKTRKAGSTAGTTDKYYKDPVTGHRFRSKNEVLSFLQTGHMCRYKPLIKPLEGPAPITMVSSLLPQQELRLGHLDGFQTAAVKLSFLPHANGFTPEASICQSTGSHSLISERISVKQEQEDVLQGGLVACCYGSKVQGVATAVEGSCKLEIQGKCDHSNGHGSAAVQTYQEPVQLHKRKMEKDSSHLLPPKRLCSKVKEMQEQNKWITCMSSFSHKSEAQAASSGMEPIDARVAHTSYPDLQYKQEQSAAQDKSAIQLLLARCKAIEKVFAPYETKLICNTLQVDNGCVRELHPKKGPVNKGCEKKVPKLTLKQERELSVSLGRKLCQQFLASANETVLL